MRKRHSTRIKQKALRLFQKGFSPYEAARKLSLNKQTVCVWHNLYRAGNIEWVKSKYVRSDPNLLAQAVREYLSSKEGFFLLSTRYGISPAAIRNGYLNQLRYGSVVSPKRKGGAMNMQQGVEALLAGSLAGLDAEAGTMGRREYTSRRARIITLFSLNLAIAESPYDSQTTSGYRKICLAAAKWAVSKGVSIRKACEILGVNRGTYDRSLKCGEKKSDDEEIIIKITEIQKRNRGTYGIDRMTPALRMCGYIINRKRVARIMRENGLNAIIRRKRGRNYCVSVPAVKVTDLPINILNRDFLAFRPGEKLVSDVTYLPLEGGGWCYVSLVKDLATSEIVSCVTSLTQNLQLGFDTLSQLRGKTRRNCIFHTDQGLIYTHPAFRGMLESMGMVQSLSRKGNCLDNAAMESFNGSMKCEWFYPRFGRGRWRLTFKQATALVNEYVTYYNERRIQKKLGWLTPVQFREKLLKKGF